jgi:hypothetical protein
MILLLEQEFFSKHVQGPISGNSKHFSGNLAERTERKKERKGEREKEGKREKERKKKE